MNAPKDSKLADAFPEIFDRVENTVMLKHASEIFRRVAGVVDALSKRAHRYGEGTDLTVLENLFSLPDSPALCAKIVDLLVYGAAPDIVMYEVEMLEDEDPLTSLIEQHGFKWVDKRIRDEVKFNIQHRKKLAQVGCMSVRQGVDTHEALRVGLASWGFRLARAEELIALGVSHPECFLEHSVVTAGDGDKWGLELSMEYMEESEGRMLERMHMRHGKALTCIHRNLDDRSETGVALAVARLG
jgi:hypothetical protein